MTLLAYFDLRPYLFLGGLPVFIGCSLLVCWLAKVEMRKSRVALVSALIFSSLFAFFLTGSGPFLDQKATREYRMTWEIKSSPPSRMKESDVILSFVDFPGHYVGEYSDELATYLREKGVETVTVVFEVISDYGKVRGFHEIEIAGLREWRSEWNYSGATGSPGLSPWD